MIWIQDIAEGEKIQSKQENQEVCYLSEAKEFQMSTVKGKTKVPKRLSYKCH